MSTFISFKYDDVLGINGRKNVPEALLITENSSPILLILRLLSGSIKVTNNLNGKVISCEKNFFLTDFQNFKSEWKSGFPKLISETLSLQDLSNFIDANKNVNKDFYRYILAELSHYVYESKKGSHTTAFIYIYRLLEKIAYAMPLIYTSKTQDFIQSFSYLRDLMTGNSEKKELGFFKKFVSVLFKDDPILLTSIDINIEIENEVIQRQIYNTYKKISDESMIHEDTIEPTKFSVKFTEMGSFIISLRNRFFHNMNEHSNNIQSSNVADADSLFEPVNDQCIHWIANIILMIISHSISEHQRIRG